MPDDKNYVGDFGLGDFGPLIEFLENRDYYPIQEDKYDLETQRKAMINLLRVLHKMAYDFQQMAEKVVETRNSLEKRGFGC